MLLDDQKLEVVRQYSNDETSKIVKTLIKALTLMNKYTVIPVYYIQCIVSKLTKDVYFVLIAYDDKEYIIESANLLPHLKDVVYEKMPKTITPIAIVYPKNIKYRDLIYNTSDEYYYSDLYICYGKDFKNALSKDDTLIQDCIIYRNTRTNEIRTIIKCSDILSDMFAKTISSKNLSLPLIKYAKSTANSLVPIINEIVSKNPVEMKDDVMISSMMDFVKDNQMDGNFTRPIYLFKDFMKQKPTSLQYWFKEVTSNYMGNDVKFMTVALDQYFKSSDHSSFIVYRYINDVITSLKGEI